MKRSSLGKQIRIVKKPLKFLNAIQDVIESSNQEDSFYIFNVEEVVRKQKLWLSLMPRIKTYYGK